MFNSAKFGFGAPAPKPQDPATEIARLLNQHTSHWMQLEKDIKEVKGKQEAAGGAYAAAVEGKEAARAALLEAEKGLVGLEADAEHCRAELEASQAANSKLAEEVEALRRELHSTTVLAGDAREAFTREVDRLVGVLMQLKGAHPDCFFAPGLPAAAPRLQ